MLESTFVKWPIKKLQNTNTRKKMTMCDLGSAYYEIGNIYKQFGDCKVGVLSKTSKTALCFDHFIDMLRIAETKALEERAEELKKMILVPDDKERKRPPLDRGKFLDHPGLRKCILCHHSSMEEPLCNDEKAKRNLEATIQFSEIYNKHMEEQKASGDKRKRGPKPPKGEDLVVRCICHLCRCWGPTQSSCPDCLSAQKTESHSFDHDGACLVDSAPCALCRCNCACYGKVSRYLYV